jgi:hypothetical protein
MDRGAWVTATCSRSAAGSEPPHFDTASAWVDRLPELVQVLRQSSRGSHVTGNSKRHRRGGGIAPLPAIAQWTKHDEEVGGSSTAQCSHLSSGRFCETAIGCARSQPPVRRTAKDQMRISAELARASTCVDDVKAREDITRSSS